jgi:hypothetical protein
MSDQIQWDDKPDTSGLKASGQIQWHDKPDTSELTPPGGASGSWEPEGTAGKTWRVANTPLFKGSDREGSALMRAKNYATAAPTLEESEHPTMTGIKKGLAGAYGDTLGTMRSFTSPVGLATMAGGALTEAPGAIGKTAGALGKIAGIGFGAEGSKEAYEGGKDIEEQGFTPENTRKVLGGSGQVVLGATGALHDTPLGNAGVKEVATSPVRGAAKTYNVARKAAPYVSPIAGVVEGAIKGGPVGAVVGSMTGSHVANLIKHLPEATEAFTKFGKPKIELPQTAAPVPDTAPTPKPRINVPSAEGLVGNDYIPPAKPVRGLGKIQVPTDTADAIQDVRANVGNAVKNIRAAKPTEAAPELMRSKPARPDDVAGVRPSPDDGTLTARNILKDQTDQALTKAGAKYGVDHEAYDFSKRDENRHRVERDQYVKDVVAKMPDAAVQKLVQAGQAFDDADSPLFSDADRSGASKAGRAKAIWETAHKDATPIAAPRELSPLNQKVARALGLSQRAIDTLKTSGLDDTAISKMLAKLTRSQLEQLAQ